MLFKGASAMLVPEALRASFENFSIFRHAPIFLIGMMAHAVYAEPAFAARLRAYGPALIALGLLGLLAFVAGRIGVGLLDGAYTIAFFYALLLLGVSGTRFAPVDNRACLFLGKISYSIYLSHAPILWLLSPIYARLVDLPVPTTLRFGLCLAVTLAVVLPVSWLSYRLVEAPCIQLGKRLFARLAGLRPAEAARA
jgi:peptidoglycan/LPS O-acetylase OafA/YrhL